MPFTLSHPAFALPIRRLLPGKLALSGVVLGSMSPDLEYFVRMEAAGTIGHQVTGFVLIGLPLCFALCCAYLFVVRPALPLFLPSLLGLRQYALERTCSREPLTLMDWLSFVLAAFAGFGTHLFMDAWTHRSGWFVQRIDALKQPVFGDYDFLFQWLQYLTSLAGAVLVCAWLLSDWLRWRSAKTDSPRQSENHFGSGMKGRDYAILARWAGATTIGLLVLLVKLNSMWSPILLYVWTVAPFSAAAVGIYCASIVIMTGRARQWSYGLSIVLLLLAMFWALKLGIVPYAAVRFNIGLTPTEQWIITIWVLSAVVIMISVQVNRIVKEFVRIGLKTVNNRTLS